LAEPLFFKVTNSILYCTNWQETVEFYQTKLGLPVTFSSDWFVEFQLTGSSRLSVADERRASIKSGGGAGITLTFQVENIEESWRYLQSRDVTVGPIKRHKWGAHVFYFFDPEGHRLEFWADD